VGHTTVLDPSLRVNLSQWKIQSQSHVTIGFQSVCLGVEPLLVLMTRHLLLLCRGAPKVKVTLRPTISRPVRLGVRRPSGTRDQFFFLLEIFF
jgi:hypothetical protein